MTAELLSIDSGSASEFLNDLLRLRLDARPTEVGSRYVFRGQGDSSWGLVPSAFRPRTILGYENRERARIAADEPKRTWDQGDAEFLALAEFLTLADEVGLGVPGDCPTLRQWNRLNNIVGHRIGIDDWPPEELFEALAVAQHHGVPTRLLDLSYNPLVAAYFAAENPPDRAKQVAVWCIDRQLLALATKELRCSLRFVTVPKARNSNLAAQEGLFLLDLDASKQSRPALELAIAEQMRQCVQHGRVPTESRAVTTKYCLRTDQCHCLLELLRRLGVDRAHLMPSLGNVVQELEARRQRSGLHNRIPFVGRSG